MATPHGSRGVAVEPINPDLRIQALEARLAAVEGLVEEMRREDVWLLTQYADQLSTLLSSPPPAGEPASLG
jgi:hypothetical protein